MNSIFVSVIIPVYNDTPRLNTCLQALSQQTHKNFEVIVVDNASTEPVSLSSNDMIRLKLVTETRRGSYAARNQGIRNACGEVLAYTDADCIPADDWIEKGVANLTSAPCIGVAGGRIDLFPVNSRRLSFPEIYELFATFRQDRSLPLKHYSSTANLFTYRKVVDQIGLFRDDLISGGDVEWCQRVYQAGYQLVYAQDACVKHPMRHTIRDLSDRHRRFAHAEYDLQGLQRFNLGQIFLYLLKSLFIPLDYLLRIFQTARVERIQDRLIIIIIEEYLRWVKAWEILRIFRNRSTRLTK